MKSILVVGSINIDLVMSVDSIPKIGETINCTNFDYMYGGKGANQAIAALRVGSQVQMIGCIGNDTFGKKILDYLSLEGMNTESIKTINGTFTGIASVMKTPCDNCIVISGGANEYCLPSVVDEFAYLLKDADAILIQNEIPTTTLEYVIKKAYEYKKIVVYNPAPYKFMKEEIYNCVDYITPNETEFQNMVQTELTTESSLFTAMKQWQHTYRARLIVTRGSQGVSYVDEMEVKTIDAIHADIVDTTGAGDTFNAVLTSYLVQEKPLDQALEAANAAAAISIGSFGAQTGMPTKEELEEFIIRKVN